MSETESTSSRSDSAVEIALETSPSSSRKLDKKKKQVSFVVEKNQVIELPKVEDEEIFTAKEGKEEHKKVKSTNPRPYSTNQNSSKKKEKEANIKNVFSQTREEIDKKSAKDNLNREKAARKPAVLAAFELGNLTLAAKYVITDTRRHKKAWLIGFFTVFIVVIFTSLMQNSIAKSPIVFLKLSEDQVGEYDLLLTPVFNVDVQSIWLNTTELSQKIAENAPSAVGVAPRWVFLAKIASSKNPTYNTSTAILILDSDKEKEIGLGRAWEHPTLGEDETHVSSSVLRALGVTPNKGESVILTIDFISMISDLGIFPGGFDQFVREAIRQNGFNLTLSLNQIFPILENTLGPLGVNVTALLNQILGGNFNYNLSLEDIFVQIIENLRQQLTIRKEYLAMDGIDSPKGKYPKAIGNVAILEAKYVKDLINQLVTQIKDSNAIPNGQFLEPFLPFFPADQRAQLQQLIDALNNINDVLDSFQKDFVIQDYAFTSIVMYKDRFKTYIKSKDDMNLDLIKFTNEIADAIGYDYPASFSLPLQTALTPLYYIRLFLDQIFTFVIVVLIGLGSLLIYSLLLSNVEEKTYEYGMLRAQGMKQYVLIELLLFQSLSFSLPGILAGLLASFLLFIPVAKLISNFAVSPLDITFEGSAVGLGIGLGLVMPLVAIIGPIRRALSRTLRDALDIYHQVQSETQVSITKLENLGLSPWQIAASSLMIVMGFIVYYLIPYAFTFQNLTLFFTILIFILIGMLLGLSLIGMTIQPFAERLSIYLLIWGSDYRTLSQLVRKNLSSHSRRNIKTAIMFTTSLAFIIFAGASFALQGHTISQTVRLASGADLLIFSYTTPLNDLEMRAYLNAEMEKANSLVRGFSFISASLSAVDFVVNTKLSNLAAFPLFNVDIYGVEENFLDETYVEFFRPTEVDSRFKYNNTRNGKPNVLQSLYTDAGKATLPQEQNGIQIPPDITSINMYDNFTLAGKLKDAYTEYVDVIISEALRDVGSIEVKTPLRIAVTFLLDEVNGTRSIYLGKSRAMVGAVPGFFFSSYRQTADDSSVIVSMDAWYRIYSNLYNTSTRGRDTPMLTRPDKFSLRVRLKENPTKQDREAVINGLRNFISDDLIQIIDATDIVTSTKSALDLLTLFFNIISIIAVLLCFFVLWLSFTANVNENSWEFGVLRAVGLNVSRVIRMYIYEAMALILSSVVIGAVIGLLVSITLTLQFNLFTELAFTFDFPYTLFFSVFAMSIAVSIIGSWSAAFPLKKKDIAIALKNM